MVINQLFNVIPPMELLNKLIKMIGLKDITDKTEFGLLDIEKNNTLHHFKSIEKEIRDCYIPCKSRKYIPDPIDFKSLITIFRQILRMHDYDLDSREKFIKRNKYIIYRITTKEEKEAIRRVKRVIPHKEITVVFD